MTSKRGGEYMHKVRHSKTVTKVFEVPFLHAIAIAMIGSGLGVLNTLGPAPAGKYSVLALCVLAVLAGLTIIVGIHWRGTNFMSNAIERTGHVLGAGVWVLDALIIASMTGWSFALVTPVALLLASIVRIIKLSKHNKAIVDTVHKMGGGCE